MRLLKSTLLSRIAASAALVGMLSGPATASKPCVTQTEVAAQDSKPVSRTEMLADLPYDVGIYFDYENQGSMDFLQLRAQKFPLKIDSARLGVAMRYVNCATPNIECGPALQIIRTSPDSFAKAELRYFSTEDLLESYAFYSRGRLFADLLSCYNVRTCDTMLRPGIDYQVDKNISIGPEAKFSGAHGLKTDYIGLRAKFRL